MSRQPRQSAKPDRCASSPNVFAQLVQDPRPVTGCLLVTDECQILSGFEGKSYTNISSKFSPDPDFPDPYLEIAFLCRYHEPEDTTVSDDIPIGFKDHVGNRNTHRAWIKLTSVDNANLRIIKLEARTDENKDLHNLRFSEAIAKRAIVPENILQRYPHLKKPAREGKLQLLRIEVGKNEEIKMAGIHSELSLHDMDTEWQDLRKHVMTTHSFNVVAVFEHGALKDRASEIKKAWQKARKSPGPFYKFFGTHPTEPFVCSDFLAVPRERRPTNFHAPGQFSYMHIEEYMAALTSAYVDEMEYRVNRRRDAAAVPMNVKLIEVPNTDGRECFALIHEDDIAPLRLKRVENVKAKFMPQKDTEGAPPEDLH